MSGAIIGAIVAVVVLALIVGIGFVTMAGLNLRYGETLMLIAVLFAMAIGGMAGYRRKR